MAATTELNPRQTRQVYLITYSRANITRFTRETFSHAVLNAFQNTPAQTVQWVCAQEQHEDGGIHFHMAIKLDRVQRWLRVKQRLQEEYDIIVHFSSAHVNYYSAWLYCTKEDAEFLSSPDHPVLENAPNTQEALQALTQAPRRKRKRKQRLSNYEVGEVAIANNLKTRLQLLAFANAQKIEGKTDIAEFVMNRSKKVVDELLSTAWDMAGAEAALQRAKLRRVEILRQTLEEEVCVPECNQQWLLQAMDILQRNNINRDDFCSAIQLLLIEGRGKYRNIIITGPTNCGKTFLLKPLTTVYKVFSNPATTTYAWIGAAEAEVILLNDFRWSSQVHTGNMSKYTTQKNRIFILT